ncbi:MAG: 5-formyltetrahydrofolate cyclo-ligase [Candidatus Omnitrophica bacterium]|nr:5-formyltetrahydrofolate cyclo-ligase [Candidatus Omnitrophota bacterium]
MGIMKARIEAEKKLLRAEFRRRLRHHPKEERERKSRIISEMILDLPAFRKAQTVMLYMALDEEVGTRELLALAFREKKQILLPVLLEETNEIIAAELLNSTRMKPGKYGIMEPESWSSPFPTRELDIVFVPGLAFDRNNHRLGRGKGYYDKFLCQLSPRTSTVGLAFDFQLVEELPVDVHDIKLDIVVHH